MALKHILPLLLALASAPLASDPRPTWGDPFGPGDVRPDGRRDGTTELWGHEPPMIEQEYPPSPYADRAGPGNFGYPSGGRSDPGGYFSDSGLYGGPPSYAQPGLSAPFGDGAFRPVDPAGPGFGDHQGYRFRPADPNGEPALVSGRGLRFDPGGLADAPAPVLQGYRFRGDPASGMANWQSPSRDALYRFRPLDDQELGRLEGGNAYRPVPQRARDGGWEPSAIPRDAYGFEPGQWRSR